MREKLEKKDLRALWRYAQHTKRDFDKFQETFSEGFEKGLEKICNDKEWVHENLVNAAIKGNVRKFTELFAKGLVDVNEYYNWDMDNRTFLNLIIMHDVEVLEDENAKAATQGRIEITRFLLKNGARIDKTSYDVAGGKVLSPIEACNDYMNKQAWRQNKSSWDPRLFFSCNSQTGKNIFPLIKEYEETLCANEGEIKISNV